MPTETLLSQSDPNGGQMVPPRRMVRRGVSPDPHGEALGRKPRRFELDPPGFLVVSGEKRQNRLGLGGESFDQGGNTRAGPGGLSFGQNSRQMAAVTVPESSTPVLGHLQPISDQQIIDDQRIEASGVLDPAAAEPGAEKLDPGCLHGVDPRATGRQERPVDVKEEQHGRRVRPEKAGLRVGLMKPACMIGRCMP